MLASFLLALREGLEMALVVGIVLGALRKMGRQDQYRYVWNGVVVASLLALAAAIGLSALGAQFTGAAEEIFEGVMMLVAAGLLTWMIFWMQRQSRTLRADLETSTRRAALGASSGKWGLFGLALFAVGREGLELALFLTAAGADSGALQTILGALLGLAAAAGLGWMLFASTRRLNLKTFFAVTNVLLVLFAAGLVAHGVHELNEAGIVPNIIEHVWDVNFILHESSVLGVLLKTLVGYNANPSLTEVIAYLAYYGVLFLSLRLAERRQPQTAPAQG